MIKSRPYFTQFWEIATKKCNSFLLPNSSRASCLPFLVNEHHVGFIRPDFLEHFLCHPSVFSVQLDRRDGQQAIGLNQQLTTCDLRSAAVADVLHQFRKLDYFVGLRGWRNEEYGVYSPQRADLLVRIERSACSLFGVTKYGVHVNGFVPAPSGIPEEMKVWVATRSKKKATYPQMFDNLVGGGLNVQMGITECAKNECQEEASITDGLLTLLRPVGTVSFVHEDERGIFPEVEYCYDIMLPKDFKPFNTDGEVEKFDLCSIPQLMEMISGDNFKPNSALVALDFLYRHGFVSPDEHPEYIELFNWMHVKLPFS